MYTYIKYKISGFFNQIIFGRKSIAIPKLININSKLVIGTTIFLIVVGSIIFYIFENSNTLQGMNLSLKIAHSFFGSVTPRTAGFNSINYSGLSVATVVLTIFLMW
jgi:Trk-type K+ transport system membrane component